MEDNEAALPDIGPDEELDVNELARNRGTAPPSDPPGARLRAAYSSSNTSSLLALLLLRTRDARSCCCTSWSTSCSSRVRCIFSVTSSSAASTSSSSVSRIAPFTLFSANADKCSGKPMRRSHSHTSSTLYRASAVIPLAVIARAAASPRAGGDPILARGVTR